MIRNHIEYWVVECIGKDWRGKSSGPFGSAVIAALALRDVKELAREYRPGSEFEIMREWITYYTADHFQVVDVETEPGTWEPVVDLTKLGT